MTPFEWFSVGVGVVSVLGVWLTVIAWWHGRATHQLIADSRDRTQGLLARLHAETQTTLRVLGEGQKSLGDILDRMDRAAEARYEDLRDRLDGGTDAESTP